MSRSNRDADAPPRRVPSRRRAWAERATSNIPRPQDAPRGHAPGHDSDRILLFGAGPAVGWGVATHELALPGALARVVSGRTGRGCDVDLVADPDMTVATAPSHVHRRDLSRYDTVVVTLGVNDALQRSSISEWSDGLRDVLSILLDECAHGTAIVVVGIQPIRSIAAFDNLRGARADRHARAMNRETQRICDDDERLSYVALPALVAEPEDRYRHRTARMYHRWAQVLADGVIPLLATGRVERPRNGRDAPLDERTEATRQRAVDRLELPAPATTARLRHILTLAQQAFGAKSAMITIIDHDRQWKLAGTDGEPLEISRAISFCDVAIRGDEALVVRDASVDDRFRENPMVVGVEQLRFYAGFPIEAPQGERLGALCVLDSTPRRPADDLDVDLLRELAHLVQSELWPVATENDEQA